MTNNYSSPPSHTSRNAPSGPKQSYQVYLLDGNPIEVTVGRKAKGEGLLQEVFNSMNPPLDEKDYFCLTFDVLDEKEPIAWLDRGKSVEKQMKKAANPAFAMNVKFYPPDPTSLMEYSRYLFYLQIRDDVAKGKLPCSLSTLALLGSFVCQADQGDYTPEMDLNAIQDLPLFSPHINQAEASILLERILTLYRTHRGMTTAEAELNYLEVAKKLTLYGVTLKPCSDSQGVRLMLGVNASGIIVFRNQLRLNRFAWAKIVKISYKKAEFSINLHRNDYDDLERTVVFKMDSQKEAKSFWKTCIEHHQFFRLLSANPRPRKIHFGSSHPTLIGQTEYEIKKSATLNRNDTFPRNTLPARRTQTLPNVHASASMRAPPSPQSGEYEPRRHEQIQSQMNPGMMNGNSGYQSHNGDEPGMNHLYSVPQRAMDEPHLNLEPTNVPLSHAPPPHITNPNDSHGPYSPNPNGDVVQHATVVTTVRTSIRMPPDQPPPRVTHQNPNSNSVPSPTHQTPMPTVETTTTKTTKTTTYNINKTPTSSEQSPVHTEIQYETETSVSPVTNGYGQRPIEQSPANGGFGVSVDVGSDSDDEINAPLIAHGDNAGNAALNSEQVRTASIVVHQDGTTDA